MKDKPFKAAPNRREWYGFNLLQGHIFGIYEGVPYVSNAAPGPRPGTIYAYQCTITPDCFHWEQVTIPAASELGKLLIVAQAYNLYGGAKPMPIKRDDHVWPPKYPTANTKRKGHYLPRPPTPQVPKTWVDAICASAY